MKAYRLKILCCVFSMRSSLIKNQLPRPIGWVRVDKYCKRKRFLIDHSANFDKLEKMSNENKISLFLEMWENILLQQHDLLQQNKEITKNLPRLTTKFDLLGKK